MKKAKKIGLVSAFCTAMLSLSACAQNVYGPPLTDSSSCADPGSSEIECVYGPPVAEDSESSAESGIADSKDESSAETSPAAQPEVTSDYEAPESEQNFDPADNKPRLVYGPPPALDDNAAAVIPE